MKTRTNQPVVANGTPTGEIDKVLGISANGKIVKGTVSGGTKLYKHTIQFSKSDSYPSNVVTMALFLPFDTPITTANFKELVGMFNDRTSKIISYLLVQTGVFNSNICGIEDGGIGVLVKLHGFKSDGTYITESYSYLFGNDVVSEV